MAKTVGQKDGYTVHKIRDAIWESMVENLLETEVLFYYLVEELGVHPSFAEEYAMDIFKGGGTITSCQIEGLTAQLGRRYELSPKQAWVFMKRNLNSSRIQVIDTSPNVWEVNGFSTFEPPYIAGYESILHDMMNGGKVTI